MIDRALTIRITELVVPRFRDLFVVDVSSVRRVEVDHEWSDHELVSSGVDLKERYSPAVFR